MKSKILLLAVVGLACCCIAACSTSNQSNALTPDWTHESFSVRTDSGTGTFTPELKVDEQATGATVTITAKDAADLSAAYVTLLYNTERYTPQSVEVGDFMGREGEYISLALTNRWQEVPVGIAQIPSTGVGPRNGTGVLAVVHFVAEPFRGARSVSSKSPGGASNAITDLTITANTSTTADLRWTERNTGDYDNNSLVNLSDLTPIAQLFGQQLASAPDQDWLRLVDGDHNGLVNLSDITPIAQNFQNQMSGYILYTDGDAGSTPYGTGITVPRPSPVPTPHAAVVYTFQANFTAGSGPVFAVRPASAGDVDNPGPVSNEAELIDEPGDPNPPTNLTVTANSTVGPHNLQLGWTLSTSGDVGGYNIERKKSSEATFVTLTSVSASTTLFTDTSLDDESYDYRVCAVDFTSLTSTWAGPASGTPWVFVVSPPVNVAAEASNSTLQITVTWDAPADFSAVTFNLFKKGPADASFVLLQSGIPSGAGPFQYIDNVVNSVSTYEYRLTSVNGALESIPSNTASATTIDQPFTINSVTTSKTTHLQAGTETAANLNVTMTGTPDSIAWSGAGDFSSTSIANPTWHPNGTTPLGKCILTVTCTKGGNPLTGTVTMYVTSAAIQTSRGVGGHFVDYSDVEFLESINAGGATATGRALSTYAGADKVVWYTLFGIW